MRLRGAIALAAMLGLAACAQSGAPPAPERQVANAPPPARATPPPVRRATPPAPDLTLRELLGREPAQIDARIGAPDLVRREGDGELRIYRSPDCVLHVFAYPRDGARQATHIEARAAGGRLADAEADACVAGFARS